MKKWLLIAALILLAFVVVPVIVGYALPRDHVASSSISLGRSPDSVWAVVRDFAGYGNWWGYVERMERQQEGDREVWLQYDTRNQMIPYEVMESVPPRRLVTRIVDDGLPFGGTWTYEIGASQAGSTVTITEDGQIHNPIFRLVSRWVLGYHATMDGYLTALGERFGETVTPVHLD